MTNSPEKRIAIVGTAHSWRRTPWDDPSLEIWTLNDSYMSRDERGRGMQRIDRHFELHPLDHFYFRKHDQKIVRAEDVPPGYYVRPEGHLEWLQEAARTIPVYLQKDPPEGWPPNAQRFPLERVIAEFGDYWASGPQYMVALAILEGATEIHIYGIHLSTQAEYIEQRPLFEQMLGIAKGRGIKVYMAEESPVMRHGWKYAYEPKPQPKPDPARQAMKAELKQVAQRKGELVQALMTWPRFKSKTAAMDELRRLQVIELDIQQQLSRVHMSSTIAAMVAA